MAVALRAMCFVALAVALLATVVNAQSPWEDTFLKLPNRARAYEHLAFLTSLPHLAGMVLFFYKIHLEDFTGLQFV